MGKYEITNEAESVRIDIYGDIGENYWDDDSVSAKDFCAMVAEADGKPLDIHVNSGGGSVFDAYAMMTAIRAHKAPVTVHVDGIAASAASYFPAAADRVLVAPEAWMMIHDASGICCGNRHDMAETADFLGKVDDCIAGIYAKRAEAAGIGKTIEDYAAMMDATTWFTAEEAVEAGLADEVEDFAVEKVAATMDRCTIDSAPEEVAAIMGARDAGENIEEVTADVESHAQEGEAVAQERVYVFGDKIFRI